MNSKIHRISKGEKRKINCTENYSTNTNFNIKTRFAREEKKNAIKSEMSWGNVIRRTRSDFSPIDNFPHTSTFTFILVSLYIYPRKN